MAEDGAEAAAVSSSPDEDSERSEEVMSEVHLGCPPRFSGPFVSNFTFSLPSLTDDANERCDGLVESGSSVVSGRADGLDEDGDLVLPRRKKVYNVAIQHKITSTIPDVGLQVWKAALVLADFILNLSITSSDFDNVAALELGSGTGFVGIILARVSRTLFLTDRDVEILDNCAVNVHLNSSMYRNSEPSVYVRELDWTNHGHPVLMNVTSLLSSEIEETEKVSLLLAADVIYSEELTESFFSAVESLMSRGSEKVLYLSLEKRYNFSLDDVDVVANGYRHFRSFLKHEEECRRLGDAAFPCFVGEQIDLSGIPQFIWEYERGKDLEIWKITYAAAKSPD